MTNLLSVSPRMLLSLAMVLESHFTGVLALLRHGETITSEVSDRRKYGKATSQC